jgi:hypothetical protein
MKRSENKWIYIFSFMITFLLICLIIAAVLSNKKNDSNYIKEYKSISELQKTITFDLVIPAFIDEEKDLSINSVLGQIIEISNENFKLKASIFVDNEADVLGIYDELQDDEKFTLEENSEGLTFFRYRNSGIETILNWVREDTSYGLILAKSISLDEAKELVGIEGYELIPYESENGTTETNESTEDGVSTNTENLVGNEVELTTQNIKFTLPLDVEITTQEIVNEAIYYLVDNKVVMIVAYNNPNKYLETIDETFDSYEYNGVYFIYAKQLDESAEENSSFNRFVSEIDTILQSISLIGN